MFAKLLSMLFFWRGMVSAKIVGLTGGSILVTALLLVAITFWQNLSVNKIVSEQVEELNHADLAHLTENVYTLVQTQDESIQQKLNDDLSVARYIIERQGGIHTGKDQISWTAANQYNGDAQKLSLPGLFVGVDWLGQNADADVETLVVDHLQSMVGGTSTIFQRMNADGDLLRVATNVLKKVAKRAIGTYIPAVNPDGAANPVVQSVLEGKTYRGLAYVVDAWYVAAYEPIFDQQGEVIGALYVGVKQENIDTLRNAIIDIQLGESGYVYVLGGQGAARGQYIISKDGERDGENIWETTDADGELIIQAIIHEAIQLEPGEVTSVRYRWQNLGETQPRWKIVYLTYYQPWDWVIGVGAYEDEIFTQQQKIDANQRSAIYAIIIAAVVIICLGGLFASLVARRITRPLVMVTEAMDRVVHGDIQRLSDEMGRLADGDLTRSIDFDQADIAVSSQDEIGRLTLVFNNLLASLRQIAQAYNLMARNMHGLVGQVAENAGHLGLASGQLNAAASQSGQASSQIAATIQQVARGILQEAEAVSHTAASVDRISQAIHTVDMGAQEQASAAQKASQLAGQFQQSMRQVTASVQEQARGSVESFETIRSGVEAVEKTVRSMYDIKDQVGLSTRKVQEMSRSSAQIGGIVETIDEIASQTNLLALNAAIEAARAGEYGKGFAVVADEVRKLAEKSALATREISGLIKEIQKTSNEAAFAMDRSAGEVEKGILQAGNSSQALSEIISAAETSRAYSDSIAADARKMSEYSNELMGAIENVSAVVEANIAATAEMTAGSSQISGAIENIASVSEENSASVEQVSASTEEMNAQFEEVTASAQALADMAGALRQLVSRFKLASGA